MGPTPSVSPDPSNYSFSYSPPSLTPRAYTPYRFWVPLRRLCRTLLDRLLKVFFPSFHPEEMSLSLPWSFSGTVLFPQTNVSPEWPPRPNMTRRRSDASLFPLPNHGPRPGGCPS